jgi:hypothetical protein
MGRQIINFRVCQGKSRSDFEHFSAAGIASIPARENPQ